MLVLHCGKYLQRGQMFQFFSQAKCFGQGASKTAQAVPGHPHGILAAGGQGHGVCQFGGTGGQGRGKAQLGPPYLGFKKGQTQKVLLPAREPQAQGQQTAGMGVQDGIAVRAGAVDGKMHARFCGCWPARHGSACGDVHKAAVGGGEPALGSAAAGDADKAWRVVAKPSAGVAIAAGQQSLFPGIAAN